MKTNANLLDVAVGLAIGDRRDLQRGRAAGSQLPRRALMGTVDCGNAQCLAIGQCGCGGSPVAMAYGGPSSGPPVPGGFGGQGQGGGGDYTAGDWDPPPPGGGCYPPNACGMDGRFMYRGFRDAVRSRARRPPYVNPWLDWIEMDFIVSAPTTILPGATTDVTVTPANGTFAVFYYEIVVVDPTTQVAQVDWRSDQPRVSGCPVPCASPTGPQLAQFVQKVPEACCGQPLVAWLDRASENLPLIVSITNNQTAASPGGDLLAQVKVRGYCCSTRVC